ncbi:MAG: GxxExxY protein [Bacteroidia bacterium]
MNIAARNILTKEIFSAYAKVHNYFGPGLLESVYELSLLKEFELRNIRAEGQVRFPIHYKGLRLEHDYTVDIVVEGEFMIMVRSLDPILSIHEAQLDSYMKMAKKELGFLLNFNGRLRDGFKQITRDSGSILLPEYLN